MKAYRLFSPEEAAALVDEIRQGTWESGKASYSKVAKNNEELRSDAGDKIEARIMESPIPKMHFVDMLSPIKFNRYREGMEYGLHSDSSQMHGVRTDLACTVFLTDDYEGGELVVGGNEVKLPAGEAIVYDCWRPHAVKPVTKGERIAAILWMQSYIQTEEQRDLLGMLRGVIVEIEDKGQFARLGTIHEKLVKLWWR